MNPDSFQDPCIDLYTLHLLRLIARHRSFTAAANVCGLSQSALTRQVQGAEARLGIGIFERTTRTVTLTEPGAILLRETEAIPNILGRAMRRIREEYLGERREIRIGISRGLAMSHIAGIFHPQKRLQPEVGVIVSQPCSAELMHLVGNSGLDLGILTLPEKLPANVTVSHRMTDVFSIIASSSGAAPPSSSLSSPRAFREWAAAQSWLMPPRGSRSRELIDAWLRERGWPVQPAMELENFDLAIHFAAMGMGAAFVPRRGVSAFPRKRLLHVIPPPAPLTRELIVISPSHAEPPEHVSRFIAGILFS